MKAQQDTTLYEERQEVIDHKTGELVTTSNKKVIRREKSPEFVMMFTAGLSILTKSELTSGQAKTLFELLNFCVNNSNMLMVNTDTKKMIAKNSGLTQKTTNENIRQLVKKVILIKDSNTYFLNPMIFGRGNFQDLKKLTHELSISYDFENNTATNQLVTKSLYEEPSADDKVIDTKEHKDNTHTEQNITIEAPNANNAHMPSISDIATPESAEQPPIHPKQQTLFEVEDDKGNSSLELEMLREQNRAEELAIKKLELQIKAKELGL